MWLSSFSMRVSKTKNDETGHQKIHEEYFTWYYVYLSAYRGVSWFWRQTKKVWSSPLVLSAVWISLLKPSLSKVNIEIIYAALLVSLTVTVSARPVVYFHVSNYYSLTLFNATVSLNDLTISKLGSLGVLKLVCSNKYEMKLNHFFVKSLLYI